MLAWLRRDRRRRLAPPRTLRLFGGLFLAAPVFNYLQIAWATGYSPRNPFFLLLPGIWPSALPLFASFVVGVGLLRGKKWGWLAFLVFAAGLIAFNGVAVATHPAGRNLWALFWAALAIASVIYFCRPDIAAPYFKMYPRGWRLERRFPLRLRVLLDGDPHETTDASDTGVYVHLPTEGFEVGQAVALTLPDEGAELSLAGGVVRVDAEGLGIAFRDLDKDRRRKLHSLLRKAARVPPSPQAVPGKAHAIS